MGDAKQPSLGIDNVRGAHVGLHRFEQGLLDDVLAVDGGTCHARAVAVKLWPHGTARAFRSPLSVRHSAWSLRGHCLASTLRRPGNAQRIPRPEKNLRPESFCPCASSSRRPQQKEFGHEALHTSRFAQFAQGRRRPQSSRHEGRDRRPRLRGRRHDKTGISRPEPERHGARPGGRRCHALGIERDQHLSRREGRRLFALSG